MSDWIETLDLRRAGLIEGFHGAGERIDRLDADQVPTTATQAPDSDAPAPPQVPTESATGGHRQPVAPRAKRAAARKTTAAKKSTAARKR